VKKSNKKPNGKEGKDNKKLKQQKRRKDETSAI
jgi:hypothetical protein